MSPAFQVLGLLALVAAAFAVVCRAIIEDRARRSVQGIFEQYIFKETICDMKTNPEGSPVWKDMEWTKQSEAFLVRYYGGKWIAVIDRQVVASATTGDEAWAHALAKNPGRRPAVRRMPDQIKSGLTDGAT